MADDGGLRPLFRQHLRIGFWWTTIETGVVAGGVPDSHFTSHGHSRWVEYKQTEGWTCPLRPDQVGWNLAHWRHGGVSYVATRRWHDGGPRKGPAVDELWLHALQRADVLKESGLRAVEPLLVTSGGPARWDWSAIQECLLRERQLL